MDVNPLISVLLSTFNNALFLQDAINSVIEQSFTDLEIIIINDGSTDETKEILDDYDDGRVRIINNNRNLGLVASLNKGLKFVKGKYIARMDADDISLPSRFLLQKNFLDSHPDIGVLGSWMQEINEKGLLGKIYSYPEEDATIKWEMIFNSSIAHATTMMRTHLLRQIGGYHDIPHAEDYDLWQRLKGITKFHNLSEIIYLRREHENRVGVKSKNIQIINTNSIRKTYLEQYLNKNITFEVAKSLANPSMCNKDMGKIAVLYLDLFSLYLKKNKSLSKKEQKEIKSSVADKLYILSTKKPIKMLFYIFKAFYLKPYLIIGFIESIQRKFRKRIVGIKA